MSQYLPVRCFEWMKDCDVSLVSSESILAMSESAQSGMILEVDLEYPDCLHDQHRDFPLAPEHLTITSDMLSNYQTTLLQKTQMKHHESRKLVPNLYNKSHYIVHYINLKFYLSHGLKLTKIHRILQFQQEPWLKSFIAFNTLQRSLATSKFSQDLFKLINNATFGKTMENKRHRRTITLVSTACQLEKLSSQPTFKSFRIFSENLIAVERYASSLCLNKPIFTGFSVLDLSKHHMYQFHYDFIKINYPDSASTLLFMDTDSLCYSINTHDIYHDFLQHSDLFDFSNYSASHPNYSTINKKKIGKFKDENAGVLMTEFVGLRAKCYSFTTNDGGEVKKGKGIKKSVIQSKLRHQHYKSCLFTQELNYQSMNTFRTHNHHVSTFMQTKLSLNCFDDKRYITSDGVTTLPYGHHSI